MLTSEAMNVSETTYGQQKMRVAIQEVERTCKDGAVIPFSGVNQGVYEMH